MLDRNGGVTNLSLSLQVTAGYSSIAKTLPANTVTTGPRQVIG